MALVPRPPKAVWAGAAAADAQQVHPLHYEPEASLSLKVALPVVVLEVERPELALAVVFSVLLLSLPPLPVEVAVSVQVVPAVLAMPTVVPVLAMPTVVPSVLVEVAEMTSLHKSFSWAVPVLHFQLARMRLLRLPCQRLRYFLADLLKTLPQKMLTDLVKSVHLTSTAFQNIHFKLITDFQHNNVQCQNQSYTQSQTQR